MTTSSMRLLAASALCLLSVMAPIPNAAAAETGTRFFFSGDGALDLGHAHFDERVAVRYREGASDYDAAALARIRHLMRSREDGRAGEVSLRLIELIDFVEDRARPERLVLISGYRSPEFNANLKNRGRQVARASLHTEGLAADLRFAGVDLHRLWLDLRRLEVGGVGFYGGEGFLHLDAGKPRFWEAATSGVSKDLSADNARLFARTDFDRYDDLAGGLVTLHGLTVFPIRIAARARRGARALDLEATDERVRQVDGCWLFDDPAIRPALRVATSGRPEGRLPIELTTCAPRTGKTPRIVATNPVESVRPR
jgi:uncharacterized protein YcbK (DUF882 family)